MVFKTYSAHTQFLGATIVTVEVDLSKGLHNFSIVGLASKAVEEAKDRISAAIKNSGWTSPKSKNQKVVISLAPAHMKKDGTGLDLAMAVGYLGASGDIHFNPDKRLFLGELSLDGTLLPISGILPMIQVAKERGFSECFVPEANGEEAALIHDITVYPARNLLEVINHISEKGESIENGPELVYLKILPREPTDRYSRERKDLIDIADVRGQESAKRALEIAIAGGHNIVMYGPPGTGKTMLAKAAAGLLPDLSFEDMLEVTTIYSVCGFSEALMRKAPFRSPHHTASYVSMIGGGANVRPGEITLAHKGILFLDEMPEFPGNVLETMREPLEDRIIRISRAKGSAEYPANFILIGAMNPCPCGNRGVKGKTCVCSAAHIDRYKRKLSGPIIDRIDMWVEVSKVDHEKLSVASYRENSSEDVRKRINAARDMQRKRYVKTNVLNSALSVKQLDEHIVLSEECKTILNASAKSLDLSARGYHRVIKTARTIADLAESQEILPEHLYEALQYRPKILNSFSSV